jgi:hypothetical protein
MHYELYHKCSLEQGCPNYCPYALWPIKKSESWVINYFRAFLNFVSVSAILSIFLRELMIKML